LQVSGKLPGMIAGGNDFSCMAGERLRPGSGARSGYISAELILLQRSNTDLIFPVSNKIP
jgi:hypothetical protein